ncbi:MAG: methyltransferase [Clostridia bacterium]|nr:methyltransferase [Clostridia bacterium]
MDVMPGEQIDDLQYNGLQIIQKKGLFRYGTDGVLLANYAACGLLESGIFRKHKGETPFRILDIGTGCGIVPILLEGKLRVKAPETRVQLFGIEIQEEVAQMARRSVALNHQDAHVQIDIGDVREAFYPNASFDAITMNPPYVRTGSGLLSDATPVAKACHEIVCTQETMIARAAKLLKPGGLFYMINKTDRLADALCAMRESGVEPRELRLVEGRPGLAPVLFVVSGVRGGGKNLRILPNINLERGTDLCSM